LSSLSSVGAEKNRIYCVLNLRDIWRDMTVQSNVFHPWIWLLLLKEKPAVKKKIGDMKYRCLLQHSTAGYG
jgi:hypothetical protein